MSNNIIVWTPERVAILRQAYAEGKTDTEIIALFGGNVSHKAIYSKRSRLGLVAPAKREAAVFWKEERRIALKSAAEASIWHLVDLKRAGHSPTRTELHVKSDGVSMRFSPEPFATYRSPAAMLAEG